MWTVRKVRFGTVRETLQAGVAAGRSGEVEEEADE
jgi:hypothetical protein